jgi:hypothetical protein
MITYKELQEKGICWTGYKRKKGTKPYEEGSCVKEEVSSAEKHHAMVFGRMNPVTTGHEAVVNKLHAVAKEHNAGHSLVVSHSQDAKKNPLSAEQKVKHAKNAFPDTNISSSNKEKPTILHHAAELHKQGVTHLHVVAGSDRHEATHELLHKYNGQHAAHGHYNFKKITVHSSGKRDPDSEGTEGMSASKMREHAASGNKKEFHSGAPSKMKPKDKDAMYNDVRHGMGIHESVSTNEPTTQIPSSKVEKKTFKDMVKNMTKRNGPVKETEGSLDNSEKEQMDEENEKKEKKPDPVHRVCVICSEPDHKHESKREPTERFIKTSAPSKATAVLNAKRYFKKLGFKVHDAKHLNIISEELDEDLNPAMGAGAYINDFIKSTNPRFVNKSKEERRRMAIGAYMAAKAKGIKEEVEIDEGFVDDIKQSFAKGMTDKIKKSIPPQYHKHYDFDSVKSINDTKEIVKKAKTAGHMKEQAHHSEFSEEMNNNKRKFKFFKGQEHIVDPKNKDGQKTVKENVEQPSGDDSIPTQTSSPGEMDGEKTGKKSGLKKFKTSLVKISAGSVGRETEEGWEAPKIKGSK